MSTVSAIDLEDNNREVIAVVVDYIKRIRSISPTIDERIRLANVSNELKDLSVNLKIPVITAQQINRAGNMALDNASETGKEDLARFFFLLEFLILMNSLCQDLF